MQLIILLTVAVCLLADVAFGQGKDATRYNCRNRNPCKNPMPGYQYHFNHDSLNNFVQCSQWGQCYVMPCQPGLVFNVQASVCVRQASS